MNNLPQNADQEKLSRRGFIGKTLAAILITPVLTASETGSNHAEVFRRNLVALILLYRNATPEEKRQCLLALDEFIEKNNEKGGEYLKLSDLWNNLSSVLVENYGGSRWTN
jgi:hypothetical protein